MNKKILAIAVAGIVAAPMAAQAAVEVYGKANVAVGMTDPGPSTSNGVESDLDSIEMTTNNSNVGIRGEEDLGNGLSGFFQVETGFAFDTGIWSDSGRNSFVGLKGDWGKVILGNHDTPYKLSTARMDPFSDTQGDYNALMGVLPSVSGSNVSTISNDVRASNAIAYMSPSMGGLTLMGAYGVNDHADSGDDDVDYSAFSLAATYAMGPWFFGGGYQLITDSGVTNADGAREDASAWRLGAGFTIAEMTTINVAYEALDAGEDAGGLSWDRPGYYASIEHKMGSHTLAASYNAADELSDRPDSGATQFVIGGYHALSKATQMYALYSQLAVDANAGGMYKFVGSKAPAVAADESGSALMVGVIHSFSSK